MKGSEVLVHTAVEGGIEVCFANPGTTEMPLVQAFDTVPGMRPVLGLFEGVCTGAADGYGRMTSKPAMVLLHLGPGLANGIANLHNAARACTPVFVVVGEHSTWHRKYDPPLTMDIQALAGTVSGWQRTVKATDEIPQFTADGIAASLEGRISTLIVPYDCQYEDASEKEIKEVVPASGKAGQGAVEKAAGLLSLGRKTLLVLGGKALHKEGLLIAARIKAKTGCDLLAEMFPARMERGAGLPDVPRVPYLPEMAIELISRYEALVFAGTREPVSFFGYKGIPSLFVKDTQATSTLADPNQDVLDALTRLAEAVGAPDTPPESTLSKAESFTAPEGKLSPDKICTALASLQPESAIVVEEAITTGLMYHSISSGAKPFTLLTLTGGSLGMGTCASIGAAIACPDRPVINFQADGAALYTLQALQTQAREGLNIVTLVSANHRYDILRYELIRLGVLSPGPAASKLTELKAIDWVGLSEGFGVPAVSVITAEDLARELGRALQEKGPRLIEMVF